MNILFKKRLKIFAVTIFGIVICGGTYFAYYIYTVNDYYNHMSPCTPDVYIYQKDNGIYVSCHAGGSILMDINKESEKIYFSVDQKNHIDHWRTIFPTPLNTKGYQLCYKNLYGEYCFDKIK